MLAIPWLTQDLRKRFVEINNKVQCKCSAWLSHKASKAKDEVDEFIIKARQLDTPAHAKELQISIDSEVLTAHVKQVQQAKPDNIMAVAALKKITLEVKKKWQRILKRKMERKEEQGRWWGLGYQSRHQPCWLAWKNALKQLIAFVGKEDNFCPKVKKQEKGARHLKDQSDEVHRKSLVGLFSSPARLTTIWRAW